MYYPIRVTDAYEHNHLYESHHLDFPDENDREPVIAFLEGNFAYQLISDPDRAGYGDIEKLKKTCGYVLNRQLIELPVLISNYLEKGRFQIFDGRHRATAFIVRNAISECGHYGPTIEPDNHRLAPTPFLTLRVIARKLSSLGYLTEPSAEFDTSSCRAKAFTP